MPRLKRTAVVLLSLSPLACGDRSPRPVRVFRLLENEARPRDLRDETRPALALRADEGRSVPLNAVPGTSLVFSWGILKGAPPDGSVRFEVRNGPQVLYAATTPARDRGGDWISATVPLPPGASGRLSFVGRYQNAFGRPPTLPAAIAPMVGLAVPRLYVPAERPSRRTLIWISLDAVRADHLGVYGCARATSPEIDRRAKEAVVFENAIAPAPWTLPSMAAQFTSRYPSAHGAVLATLKLDRQLPTLFEALAQDGFTVLGVSANPYISRIFGLADGFDLLLRTNGNADEVNRLALRALDDWRGGDLALFVHYMDPHHNYAPPSPFDSLFGDPSSDGRHAPATRQFGPRVSARMVPRVEALYDGEIAFVDSRVHQLLGALDERGIRNQAVVVISADHGEEFMDHGGFTHGRTVYEEAIHVPLIVHLPNARPSRIPDVVSLIDLAPTLLETFGIERPPTFEGRSLLTMLRGGALDEKPAFAETARVPNQLFRIAIRERRTAYLATLSRPDENDSPRFVDEAVYDLASDPREQSPLKDSPHLARLHRQAVAFLETVRARRPHPETSDISPDLQRQLRALGYLN